MVTLLTFCLPCWVDTSFKWMLVSIAQSFAACCWFFFFYWSWSATSGTDEFVKKSRVSIRENNCSEWETGVGRNWLCVKKKKSMYDKWDGPRVHLQMKKFLCCCSRFFCNLAHRYVYLWIVANNIQFWVRETKIILKQLK